MWCCTRRATAYPKSPASIYFSTESLASRASTNILAPLLPLHISHTSPVSQRISTLPREFIGPVPPRVLLTSADVEPWLAAWLSTHAKGDPGAWADAGFPGLAAPDPVAIGERIKEGDVWTACIAEVEGMLAEVEIAQREHARVGGYQEEELNTTTAGTAAATNGTPSTSSAAQVVIKLVCPGTHPLPASDVVSTIAREAWLYDHALRPLQGVAVPRWHGVYAALADEGDEAFVAVMENAGECVKAESLTDDERQQIVEHYGRLHEAGVVHLAAEPKHWLRSSSGIRVIDFGTAILRPDADVVRAGLHIWNGIEFGVKEWEMVARFEIGEVLRVLGFEVDWSESGSEREREARGSEESSVLSVGSTMSVRAEGSEKSSGSSGSAESAESVSERSEMAEE